MSNVSKLVIKACRDNKFSSFTGEFITSINPENLVIKSAVAYHMPEGMAISSALKYRGSPPKLLSFSLLFDNTGIIPGSNAIAVMEQVKKLQEVAYTAHKKNNAPNYIRVIWGQIDFKGRLVDLDIVYSMFHVDGTLVRAEAHIAVREEITPLGQGNAAAGVDSDYAKPSGAHATSSRKPPPNQVAPSQEVFAPTPNGIHGAYSGAPPGAYDGGPDHIYQGANGGGDAVYGSSVAATPSAGGAYGSNVGTTPSGNSAYGSSNAPSPSAGAAYGSDESPSAAGLQGGVAGNGPGGSGGGIGGGGHGPGSGAGGSKGSSAGRGPGSGTTGSKGSSAGHGPGSGAGGSGKDGAGHGPGSSIGKSGGRTAPALGGAAAGLGVGSAVAAAAGKGKDSLRSLTANVKNIAAKKLGFWTRLKMLVKKVAPKTYNAVKQASKKIIK